MALKAAGLEVANLSSDQVVVVLRKLMPAELESRGIDDSEQKCEALASQVASFERDDTASADSPEKFFQRLGK